MGEEWRSIPGFPGYEVSSRGRVRSFKRGPAGQILSTPPNGRGYAYVRLASPLGGHPGREVHTLVAEAFHGPRPDGLQVRHLDGCKNHNWVENLAYGTRTQNAIDSVQHGQHRNAMKTHCKRGHAFDAANTYSRSSGTAPGRRCRACHLADARQRYERKMLAAAQVPVATP